jgi:hypothetical protein
MLLSALPAFLVYFKGITASYQNEEHPFNGGAQRMPGNFTRQPDKRRER